MSTEAIEDEHVKIRSPFSRSNPCSVISIRDSYEHEVFVLEIPRGWYVLKVKNTKQGKRYVVFSRKAPDED